MGDGRERRERRERFRRVDDVVIAGDRQAAPEPVERPVGEARPARLPDRAGVVVVTADEDRVDPLLADYLMHRVDDRAELRKPIDAGRDRVAVPVARAK